ncbi:MAG TPA: enolase C-terminal domain-like protein, partial [Woeseiaceae bacterium]|nr:enolase C-terminal domain-like protein [Woeseiaceae bacterium]
NDEPLWKTLGGTRPRARAHLAWDRPWDGRGATNWFRRRRAETGIRSASLAAGPDPAHDLKALSDVRDVLEATVPDSSLMLRFDGTSWPRDVIRHVRALETRFDLACVCSPVRRGDVRGARQIGDAVRAAVCVGHGDGDVEAFLPYLRHYAANVIELDIAALGISGSIQVADAAFGFELPVLLTGYPGHVPVHLFAALPTAMSVEITFTHSVGAVSACGITFEAGRALAGMQPGNGLSIEVGCSP